MGPYFILFAIIFFQKEFAALLIRGYKKQLKRVLASVLILLFIIIFGAIFSNREGKMIPVKILSLKMTQSSYPITKISRFIDNYLSKREKNKKTGIQNLLIMDIDKFITKNPESL